MKKLPAGASILFGALAETGQIKRDGNGTFRMSLSGIDQINWFSDRPNRKAGLWSSKRLAEEWETLFRHDEPNSQATFKFNNKRKIITFEMDSPSVASTNQSLESTIRPI